MLLGEIYEKQGKVNEAGTVYQQALRYPVNEAGTVYQQALRNPELPVQNRMYIEQKIRALYKGR